MARRNLIPSDEKNNHSPGKFVAGREVFSGEPPLNWLLVGDVVLKIIGDLPRPFDAAIH
jgi:hypothetical protein